VLDTTWALLPADEQDALRRLSIFSGSFHPQAAQEVAGVPRSLLSRLLDKTLLQETAERCQMHDMVRRYAEEKLLAHPQERGRDAATATAISIWTLSPRRQEGLFQASRQETMAAVAQEFENVVAAWQWAADHGRFAQIDRAQESLFAVCLNRGRYGEGAACFARLVQAVESALPAQELPPRSSRSSGAPWPDRAFSP
jgi:hypothetical protein